MSIGRALSVLCETGCVEPAFTAPQSASKQTLSGRLLMANHLLRHSGLFVLSSERYVPTASHCYSEQCPRILTA